MKSLRTLFPPFSKRDAVPPFHLKTQALSKVGTHLKASAKDQAIERVLAPRDHDTRFGNTFHTLTLGIDQLHVGPIKGQQIFIMKAGAFAELVVQGFNACAASRSLTTLSTRALTRSIFW